ncbi:QueT transporter family protein [Thermoflavimicrobium daqui]|uniref:Transporter n=1 Tax=Thermoflavimicrobium daqui TaxID=2137476 RepID=A0A364K9R7_9BACL|nr:QueT transporter family protein [Thermoflavimicrobium daqui]RAL27047.1 transporter [Thermoflavimicrobium daqui]
MSVRKMTTIALIAATYVVLTYTFAPLSYNYIQFRVSEVLTVLPFITPLAVPGLFIGVILSNLNSPFGIYDILFGSLSTLIAAWLTTKMPNKWLAPLPPVIVNAVIIGTLLGTIGNIGVSIPWAMLYVGIGELGVCYILGIPFLYIMERIRHLIPKQ